jgi:uracil-DNA glycosylase
MNKRKQLQLDKIAAEIAKCKICQKDKVGISVPGEGDPDADIVFIGEAPGKEEAKTGRPFIGRAGKLLRGMLAEIGIDPEDVFITSPVKYLPKHVTPTLSEIEHGRRHLFEQLDVIDPKVIVLMGNTAALAVLEEKFSIAQVHGTVMERGKRTYFLSYHPAAPLYSPKLRYFLLKYFKKLKKFL